MSKTVKRVMTVMMVGLVATLGAKAEAHYRIIRGVLKFCSVCSDLTLTEVPDPGLNPAVAELIVTTQKVRILCLDGTEVQVKKELTLIGEAPSASWSWKNGTAEVKFNVSDQPFEELGFCGVDRPMDVQILKMEARYNAYECTGSDLTSCSSRVLVSSRKLKNCTVPPGAPDGTEYVCNTPVFEHLL